MTEAITAEAKTSNTYATGNIYLAAALICLKDEYILSSIEYDESLKYNKAKFVVEYPEEQGKSFVDAISDFDQKNLIVNLFNYNKALRKIREKLSEHQSAKEN